ncbi:MAG: hypothetical protein HUU56_13075 [Bdellovibrionaceae bacterium]|nr:hypothetical protein [Pseudobdellovibrionaceae bacterium]
MLLKIFTVVGGIQFFLGMCLYVIFPLEKASFILGNFISYLNFVVLAYLWSQIIYKKRVAPSIALVVIKYGILIYLFSKIPKTDWVRQNDLVYGILINPVAIVVGGFFLKNK